MSAPNMTSILRRNSSEFNLRRPQFARFSIDHALNASRITPAAQTLEEFLFLEPLGISSEWHRGCCIPSLFLRQAVARTTWFSPRLNLPSLTLRERCSLDGSDIEGAPIAVRPTLQFYSPQCFIRVFRWQSFPEGCFFRANDRGKPRRIGMATTAVAIETDVTFRSEQRNSSRSELV
jgi:hypothetical protein